MLKNRTDSRAFRAIGYDERHRQLCLDKDAIFMLMMMMMMMSDFYFNFFMTKEKKNTFETKKKSN